MIEAHEHLFFYIRKYGRPRGRRWFVVDREVGAVEVFACAPGQMWAKTCVIERGLSLVGIRPSTFIPFLLLTIPSFSFVEKELAYAYQSERLPTRRSGMTLNVDNLTGCLAYTG